MRNELMELIQYSPQGASVHAEPVLITPAWIMKYYVLDLSPHNSLVQYLVDQGHTVFMISWKNPTAADRNLGMDDYLRLGPARRARCRERDRARARIHAVGYCIGGTLLAIGAAHLARGGDARIAIDHAAGRADRLQRTRRTRRVHLAEPAGGAGSLQMQRDGVLRSESMAAAFALLRASDLIWAPAINQYLRGQRAPAERPDGLERRRHAHALPHARRVPHAPVPATTNSAPAASRVEGRAVDLAAITVPMFVVGTETDHVAPWQSVYKTGALTRSGDYTFLLTSGGHNAGIVSGPVNAKRRHSLRHWDDAATAGTAADYLAGAEQRAGSWWPTWQQWLADSLRAPSAWRRRRWATPPPDYAPLGDAPGDYVRG